MTRPPLPLPEENSRNLSYRDFLARYVRQNRPIVVRGAALAWPAIHRWTPAYFAERFADRSVDISYSKKMRFDEFISAVTASTEERPGPYMYRLFLHEHLPDVLPDVSPPNPYAFPRRYASPLMPRYWRRPDGHLKLLIGGVGGRFPVMHFDTENVHANVTEIYGDKEFIMFAPSDGVNLYPNPEQDNQSLVIDPLTANARFPLLSNAQPYRAVLHPGDMVFIPCGWWHTARALTVSISVGANILDESNWDGFVASVGGTKGPVSIRHRAQRAYLRMVGAFMTFLERRQERRSVPGERVNLLTSLVPWSAEVAPDPSLNPLKIREGTR